MIIYVRNCKYLVCGKVNNVRARICSTSMKQVLFIELKKMYMSILFNIDVSENWNFFVNYNYQKESLMHILDLI